MTIDLKELNRKLTELSKRNAKAVFKNDQGHVTLTFTSEPK